MAEPTSFYENTQSSDLFCQIDRDGGGKISVGIQARGTTAESIRQDLYINLTVTETDGEPKSYMISTRDGRITVLEEVPSNPLQPDMKTTRNLDPLLHGVGFSRVTEALNTILSSTEDRDGIHARLEIVTTGIQRQLKQELPVSDSTEPIIKQLQLELERTKDPTARLDIARAIYALYNMLTVTHNLIVSKLEQMKEGGIEISEESVVARVQSNSSRINNFLGRPQLNSRTNIITAGVSPDNLPLIFRLMGLPVDQKQAEYSLPRQDNSRPEAIIYQEGSSYPFRYEVSYFAGGLRFIFPVVRFDTQNGDAIISPVQVGNTYFQVYCDVEPTSILIGELYRNILTGTIAQQRLDLPNLPHNFS